MRSCLVAKISVKHHLCIFGMVHLWPFEQLKKTPRVEMSNSPENKLSLDAQKTKDEPPQR